MPLWSPWVLLLLFLALLGVHLFVPSARRWVWKVQLGLGALLLAVGAYLGLAWAPAEREMGEVQRIMYVHVPCVWMGLIAVTANFGASIAYLLRRSWVSDSLGEANAEVGILFGSVGVLLGAIWAKPTWGVWWDWDPRLTSAAIMLVVYTGYLTLRKFVDDPEKRAVWSAVVGVIAFVDIPIVWFSVRWWRSLHQVQSTSKTMDPSMSMTLWWNTFAMLGVFLAFVYLRYVLAQEQRKREVALPDSLPPASAGPEVAR